jgi:hypothetical protein
MTRNRCLTMNDSGYGLAIASVGVSVRTSLKHRSCKPFGPNLVWSTGLIGYPTSPTIVAEQLSGGWLTLFPSIRA